MNKYSLLPILFLPTQDVFVCFVFFFFVFYFSLLCNVLNFPNKFTLTSHSLLFFIHFFFSGFPHFFNGFFFYFICFGFFITHRERERVYYFLYLIEACK